MLMEIEVETAMQMDDGAWKCILDIARYEFK